MRVRRGARFDENARHAILDKVELFVQGDADGACGRRIDGGVPQCDRQRRRWLVWTHLARKEEKVAQRCLGST